MGLGNKGMMNPMMGMFNPLMMDPMFLGMQIPLGWGKILFWINWKIIVADLSQMGMNPAMFGMDPANINLNAANPGNMPNFPLGAEGALNMPFMPGMFPMMGNSQSNLGGASHQ